MNRLRAAVERAISHLKNWKILKTGYHPIMTDFPDVLRTVTALESSEPPRRVLNDPPGRAAAIRQHVLDLTAPVVATALGYHHNTTTTTRLAAEAGSTWSNDAPGNYGP